MIEHSKAPVRRTIALVDGEAIARHARQLMLRAGGSEVRAYPSCAAALADPAALACACVIADLEMADVGGIELLRLMRAKGWRGAGILLADVVPAALHLLAIDEGFVAMRTAGLDDHRLTAAVAVALDRSAAEYR